MKIQMFKKGELHWDMIARALMILAFLIIMKQPRCNIFRSQKTKRIKKVFDGENKKTIRRRKFSGSAVPSNFAKVKVQTRQTSAAILSFGLTRLELPIGTDLDALAQLMLRLNGKT